MPDGLSTEQVDELRGQVARAGYLVRWTPRTPQPPPGCPGEALSSWAYTVGLTDAGLPELVVAGLGEAASVRVFAAAVRVHTVRELSGGMSIAKGVCTTELATVWAAMAPMAMVRALYGEPGRERAVQIVWPDPGGRFPGQAGYDAARFPQTLFGCPWW